MVSEVRKVKDKMVFFFTNGHERTVRVKKNILFSFFVKMLSIAINLVFVPLTISYVNSSQYGTWLTLSSIISWFSFLDIGFGNGMRNKFAEAKATGDYLKARMYVSTTYGSLLLIFTMVWICFLVINSFLDWSKILNIDPGLSAEFRYTAFFLFSFFCLQMIFRTINTILVADQRSAVAGFVDVMGQLCSLGVVYLLTKINVKGSLLELTVAIGLMPVVAYLVTSFYYFRKDYKAFIPKLSYFQKNMIKEIMGLGTKFFLVQISGIIIFQTTNIIISQILGPAQVTVYNIAYKYFFIVPMFFLIVIAPFWSAFTEAYTKSDHAWMKKVLTKLSKYTLVAFPMALGLLLVSDQLYHFWIRDDSVVIPWNVSLFLSIYVVLYVRFSVFIYLINGIGKIQLQLITNIVICVLYVPVATFFCKLYGLEGLVSVNIGIVLIHLTLSQIQIGKLVNKKAYGVWDK
ncbi:oligosaccharide flippase family protein [Runella sp. CRIBMP]|uniref:lipopolysaccharide biosynthesis protein n=1 Tax=Runella sp. CRIBMP TaxID=2683261 RepID=UPI0014137233|nr:oligosaccharide flippase family protein [Runella sp. CRIBMP]NBB22845.1 oligosaccharide flippase family protein [Runella sp. CRIBMP]